MVEKEVDLGTSLSFRNVPTPPLSRISIALLIAVAIHVLVLHYWWPLEPIQAPELPSWVNVNLVAGLEERQKPQPEEDLNEPKTTQKREQARERPEPDNRPEKAVPPEPRQVESEKQAETEGPNKTSTRDEHKQKRSMANTFVQADSRPFAMHNPRPVFPLSARRRGMQGTVILLVQVTAKGKVSDVSVSQSSGYRVLDNSAIRAVQRWKFRPARRQGDSVSTSVEVPVRFLLRDE